MTVLREGPCGRAYTRKIMKQISIKRAVVHSDPEIMSGAVSLLPGAETLARLRAETLEV